MSSQDDADLDIQPPRTRWVFLIPLTLLAVSGVLLCVIFFMDHRDDLPPKPNPLGLERAEAALPQPKPDDPPPDRPDRTRPVIRIAEEMDFETSPVLHPDEAVKQAITAVHQATGKAGLVPGSEFNYKSPKLNVLFRKSNLSDRDFAEMTVHLRKVKVPVMLRLGECPNLTGEALRSLRGVENLRRLELNRLHFTDEDFHYLGLLNQLQDLTVESDQITNTGLSGIAPLTGLQFLSLTDCSKLDVAGMIHLKGLTNLRSLYWQVLSEVTDEGLANLQGMVHLESLYLAGSRLTDAGLGSVRHLKGLRELRLDQLQQITDRGLTHLKNLTSLRELTIYQADRVPEAGFAALAGMDNLTALYCYCNGCTDEALRHFSGLTGLKKLSLNGCPIKGLGLGHLTRLKNLRDLGLSHTETDDAGLKHLAALPRLVMLDLTHTNITDEGLKHLATLPDLMSLELNETKITDAGLAHLKGAPSLSELKLDHTPVTDACLAHLSAMPALRHVSILRTKITAAGRKELSKISRLSVD
jgi:Leucine-rich repeat (LRR) protein